MSSRFILALLAALAPLPALAARNDNYGKVVNSVSSGRADRQQIAYAYALRNATTGWKPKLRNRCLL